MNQYIKINKVAEVIKKRALISMARSYKNKNQLITAETFYGKVLDKTNIRLRTSYYYEYANILHSNKKYSKALEQINYAIDNEKEDQAEYFVLRAEVYIKLKQLVNAEYDINYATDLENNNAFAHYISGIIQILQKKWYQAEESLLITQKLGYDTEFFYRRLGQASFAMGHFSKAAEAFEQAADMWSINRRSITKSDLYHMAGLSNEKLDNSKDSQSLYKKALKYDKKHNSEVLGIGIFHELNEQYNLAIDSYSQMETAEPLFRLGLLYEKMGNKTQAITTYKNVLNVNQIEAKYHFRLGVCYEDMNNYKNAVFHFKQAIARNNDHDPQLYLKLLNVLDKLNKTEEYRQVLNEASIVNDYVNNAYQNEKGKISRQERYNVFRNKLAPVKKTVLFESISGSRVTGNPLAIFKYMLEDDRFNNYTFIWTVNDYNVVPDIYKDLPNVIFVIRYTDLFYKYLSTANILINNTTFPNFFILNSGQKYLNTWHGTPWKTLGYDVKVAKMDYANGARDFLQATHLISPSQYTYDHQVVPYQIASIHPGEIAITGYPRIDLTYRSMQNKKIIKKELGIEDNEKVILYAPTWRGENSFRSFDRQKLEDDLEQLSHINAHIIFRGHHWAEIFLTNINIPNVTLAPERLDTNELLGAVDILITDYSSVFFDFLVTDKPIIHYLHDYEEYTAERGLYFGLKKLPGEVVQSTQQLIKAVQNYMNTTYQPTEKYLEAKEKFVYKDDGNVTERVIDWFIFDKNNVEIVSNENTSKKKVLFNAGSFQSNGITSAFINMIKSIDKHKYDISVTLSDTIKYYPERMEHLHEVRQYANILPRTGKMNHNNDGLFAESLAIDGISTDKTNDILRREYEEEYKRLFGEVEFDYTIDYSGYSHFYNRLLISNPNSEAKKVVYIHNDIYSEYISKHPTLYQIFEQYKKHDKIVSVSEPTSKLNISNLSNKFNVPESKFDYIENIQDPKSVRDKSTLELEDKSDEKLFSKAVTVFLTMGRLSAEKDQEKLIRAFWETQQLNPETRLLILGDGPLRHHLLSVIDELDLQNSVHLLGLKANPYPYLKQADCFVLPSNYEGQPVVLFEALILDKPIIATDIVSNRGILKDGYGELCDNSIDGLVNAMKILIAGELHSKPFDIEEYNQRAIQMFHDKVL